MRRPPARALVTGASSGIGALLAQRLAARGVEVWLAARRIDQIVTAVERIKAAGGRAHALQLDVAQVDATAKAMAKLDDEAGGIDLVIANAGVGSGGKVLSEESWDEVHNIIKVNFSGAAATLVPFIPRMLARGHGHLVGVSSLQADLAMPRGVSYGASKAALTFLLTAADLELRARGVDVTIVHPGFVRTAMMANLGQKVPFVLEAEQAAEIIDRGIQRRARMIRFPFISGALARLVNSLPRFVSRPLIRSVARVRQLPPPRG
jgi:short-subunit dehydrogenase